MADDAAAAEKKAPAKAAPHKAAAKTPEPKGSEDKVAAAKKKVDEPAPTTDEANENFASYQEDPPDPLAYHTEKSVTARDQQGHDAINAAYEYDTDLSYLGHQVEQFDTSPGSNFLTALAHPPKAALAASQRVEDIQGVTAAKEKAEKDAKAAAKKSTAKASSTDTK